jgi:hypothetical protein
MWKDFPKKTQSDGTTIKQEDEENHCAIPDKRYKKRQKKHSKG